MLMSDERAADVVRHIFKLLQPPVYDWPAAWQFGVHVLGFLPSDCALRAIYRKCHQFEGQSSVPYIVYIIEGEFIAN